MEEAASWAASLRAIDNVRISRTVFGCRTTMGIGHVMSNGIY
jgi:hypothetical protein